MKKWLNKLLNMFKNKFNKKENSIQKSHFKGNEDIGNKVKIKGLNNKFTKKKSICLFNKKENITLELKEGDLVFTTLVLQTSYGSTSIKNYIPISIIVDEDFVNQDSNNFHFTLNSFQADRFFEKLNEKVEDLSWFKNLKKTIMSVGLDTFKLADKCNLDYEIMYSRASKMYVHEKTSIGIFGMPV